MSIELKKAAQQAIEVLENAPGGCGFLWQIKANEAIAALRTAIQQAEAKTDEPVAGLLRDMQAIAEGAIKIPAREYAMHALADFGANRNHPAPGVPDDSKRLDYLQDRGATIDLIQGVADFYPMQFRVGGLHSSANTDVRAAIDAAMLTAAQAQKGQP